MANLTQAQATTMLRNLGFLIRAGSSYTTAVRGFQTGWNLGTALAVDGKMGPATSAALRRSDANRRAGKGTASANFGFREFRCKCAGRHANCRGVLVSRALLRALQTYRGRFGATSIVSGYRCPTHNRAVGGASASQHLTGAAADIPAAATTTQVRALGVFRGIGQNASTKRVRHVDMRTSASAAKPTVWNY